MIPKFGSSKLLVYNTPDSPGRDYRDVLSVVREKVIAMTQIGEAAMQNSQPTPNTSQIDRQSIKELNKVVLEKITMMLD